jgi:hypothetical protein
MKICLTESSPFAALMRDQQSPSYARPVVQNNSTLFFAALRTALSFRPQAAVSNREEFILGLGRRTGRCIDKNLCWLVGLRTFDDFF